jgi:hypothetical protein
MDFLRKHTVLAVKRTFKGKNGKNRITKIALAAKCANIF